MSEPADIVKGNGKPTVCCVMPCRTIPQPKAFKALQIAASRYGAPIDTPAREPRERNRNTAVSQFLGTKGYEWLLLVDDDTTVPEDVIERLLVVRKPIVTGMQPLYLPERENGNRHHLVANVMRFPTINSRMPNWPDWLTWERPRKPFPIFHCGFGCVLINRRVFEDTGFPWFVEDYGDQFGRNNITEDIYFCDHVRRAGFEIWCAPDVECGHLKTVDLRDIVPKCRIDWSSVKVATSHDGYPEKFLNIDGWFPQEAEELYQAVATHVPDNGVIVELGVFHGRSLCYMAEAIKQHKKEGVSLNGVDKFEIYGDLSPETMTGVQEKCRESLRRAGVVNDAILIVDDSADSAASFADQSVYFVYVDAAHDRDSAKRDIDAWLPKIAPGGIIAGDDYAECFSGVMQAVDDRFGKAAVVRGRTWAVRIGDDKDPFEG